MIRNPEEVERARLEHERSEFLTVEQKYALLNAMYEEVKQLCRLDRARDKEAERAKLRIARILNAGV
jgi:hypothetical protein